MWMRPGGPAHWQAWHRHFQWPPSPYPRMWKNRQNVRSRFRLLHIAALILPHLFILYLLITPVMSLADRRENTPRLGQLPVFTVQTPLRNLARTLSMPSSISSITPTIDTLPTYEVMGEDDNPDVITTSVEIDSDEEYADDDVVATPQAINLTPKGEKPKHKVRSFRSFVKRNIVQWDVPAPRPGVRLMQTKCLCSRSKDIRAGFPLATPVDPHGEEVLDIEHEEWQHLISRINILLANSQLNDIQNLLDSHPSIQHSQLSLTFTKLSEAKKLKPTYLESKDDPLSTLAQPFLTIPELCPSGYESDDSAHSRPSLFDPSRRGSVISTTSTTSIKSLSSHFTRIRTRLTKNEEWCILIN